ncbi:AMP-binding protein, partial [Klebsiella variicola]|uniref:AMP-binding protein n=2 Tax=Pseudomonadota TaxID=1224 RepID=UPI00273070F4
GMDVRTLFDIHAEARADHPFLIWEPFEGEGARWGYRAFRDRIARFAAGLHARGVVAGDRVLVHLDNCPEAVIAWFGCA